MATKSIKNSSKSLTRVTKILARKFVPTLLPPQTLPPLPSQNLETINASITLPVELWEAILDHVLTSPFLLEAECSPDDFYFFAVAHRAWDATSAERESRKNIRAVCRLWKAIVDRHARTWVHLESSAPVWTIPPETRRLDVFLSPAFHTSETSAALPVEPQVEGIAFRNIQVISLSESREREAHLTEAFVAGAYITPQSTLDEFNKVLKVFGWAETSVHSFIYEGRVRLGQANLQAITGAFPHLTSLTLHTTIISGILSIPTLSTLWISAINFDIRHWELPSLRHLALGDQNTSGALLNYGAFHLGPIKSRLQSLLLLCPYWVYLTPSFWAEHPALEFVGAPDIYQEHLASANNARILCITGPGFSGYNDPNFGLLNNLPRFPLLRTLITPDQRLHGPSMPSGIGYSYLSKYCADNGITWYIAYEQKPEIPSGGA